MGEGGGISRRACSGDGAVDGEQEGWLRSSSQGLAALLSQVGGHGPFSLQAKAEGHCVEFLGFLNFPISAPGLSTHTPSLSLLVGFGGCP